jgi:hypothetical protein
VVQAKKGHCELIICKVTKQDEKTKQFFYTRVGKKSMGQLIHEKHSIKQWCPLGINHTILHIPEGE